MTKVEIILLCFCFAILAFAENKIRCYREEIDALVKENWACKINKER